MRIVIDGRMLFWTGVGRYTQRLLENLEKLDHENHYFVLVRKQDWNKWEPTAANFVKVRADLNPYSLGEQLSLIGVIRSLKPDLVHFTAPNSPLFYHGKQIVTVHDLTLLDFDTSRGHGIRKSIRKLKRIPFRLVLKRAVTKANKVVTISKYTADQVHERLGVPTSRLATTLLGAEPLEAEPASIDKFDLRGDFVLYYGNYYPYKNVSSTIEAFSRVVKSRPDVHLVLAGKTDFYGAQLRALTHRVGIADKVTFLGFVSDGELVSLCRAAKLFVLPSLSEGFGLPGLEAMAQGTPVLSARASVLPEIYGDAAEYFDPHNPADQAGQILSLLGDNERLREMRELSHKRVEHFSWRKTAEQTLRVYTEVLARKDG